MRRSPFVRATAACLLVAFPAACYNYQPVAETPAPGSDVRVRLNARGALELSDVTDEPKRAYEGQMLGAGEDTVRISVLQSRAQSNFDRRRTLRSTLAIPRSAIEALEHRTLSTGKTSLVVLGAAGAVVGVILSLSGGGDGSDPGDGGENGPVATRIPLQLIPR